MGRLWKAGDRVTLVPYSGVVADVGSGGDTRVEFDDGPDSWVNEDCLIAGEWEVPDDRDDLARRLDAVLDLHYPSHLASGRKVCGICTDDDGDWTDWPCATVRAASTSEGTSA